MPNAKVLSEKQAVVAALTEKLQNAAAGVIVDYKGITVQRIPLCVPSAVRTTLTTLSSRTPCCALLSTMWA